MAEFNYYWELSLKDAQAVREYPELQAFTVLECKAQAKRLLKLALQESQNETGDRALMHQYVKLKLAFQELAAHLEQKGICLYDKA